MFKRRFYRSDTITSKTRESVSKLYVSPLYNRFPIDLINKVAQHIMLKKKVQKVGSSSGGLMNVMSHKYSMGGSPIGGQASGRKDQSRFPNISFSSAARKRN